MNAGGLFIDEHEFIDQTSGEGIVLTTKVISSIR